MRRADLALYEAKGAGKGRSAGYTAAMRPAPDIRADGGGVGAANLSILPIRDQRR